MWRSKRLVTSAAACLILADLAACCAALAPRYDVTELTPERYRCSQILGYRIRHNAPDHLALEIEYFYDGKEGSNTYLGAITLAKGQSNGYWAFRPDPVLPGKHWARVLIGMAESAPELYTTDELELGMYLGGGSYFYEVRVPFPKRWHRIRDGPKCHGDWGEGCN